ncbi:MAG: short-chain dehydrogenase [Caldiserica bacterium]|nr:MAG: short-chain dehydrogenase [Caldisericota bacterium]
MRKGFSEFDLSGKVILVTGACGLIGREICDAFSSAGANVVVSDIKPEKDIKRFSGELSKKYKRKSIGIYLDVTKRDSIESGIRIVLKEFGKIDVLVNNAAIDAKFDIANVKKVNPTRFENYPLDLLRKSIEVNMIGLILVTQRVIKEMLKWRSGNIINVSSTYAIVAPDQRLYREKRKRGQVYKPVDYIVTKSFIPGFTRYLATLYAREGIRVNTIVPHGVENNHPRDFKERFSERSPLGRMCKVSELRGPFIFLASDASSYMTGAVLVVDGGWSIW